MFWKAVVKFFSGIIKLMQKGGRKVKLRAIVQFYLPFVLPRSQDWSSAGIKYLIDDYEVYLVPRSPQEELFVNNIDKTLSKMSCKLTPSFLVGSEIEAKVSNKYLDRITVTVIGDESTLNNMGNKETDNPFFVAALRACNNFLYHCRVVGNVPFLNLIERHYRIEDGNFYVVNPFTILWYEEDSNKEYPMYPTENKSMHATASLGALRSPGSGNVSMSEIADSISKGEPDLVSSLLLDAEEKIRVNQLREAVIDISTACEISSNRYIARKKTLECKNDIKNILRSRDDAFAEKRLHKMTLLLDNRSLKTELDEVFKIVESTYRVRNKICHDGRMIVKNEQGIERIVDIVTCCNFLNSARKTISWLENL